MPEMTPRLIRELKGAPLAVLLLLSISPQPVSKDWLARSCGYTDKPIQQACEYLKEMGLADHSRAGWFLVDVKMEQEVQPPAVAVPEAAENRNISDQSLSSSRSPIKDSIKAFEPEGSNTTKPPEPIRKNSEPEPQAQLWRELFRLGLRHNTRTDAMALLPHVNREYVRALAAKMDAQGKGGVKHAGLFILACEQGDVVDERFYRMVDQEDQLLKRGRWAVVEEEDDDDD